MRGLFVSRRLCVKQRRFNFTRTLYSPLKNNIRKKKKNTRWMGSDIGRVYFSLANERSVTHSCVRAIYHLIRIKQTPPPPPQPNPHPHSIMKSHSVDYICSVSLLYLRSFHILAAVPSTALHFDGNELFIIRLHPIHSIRWHCNCRAV